MTDSLVQPPQCVVCGQPSGEEQPSYCLHCFIPITTYKLGKYTGQASIESVVNSTAPQLTVSQAKEAVENLGISHLSDAEQAVALSTLSREKINPMSGDYEFTSAGQLAELGVILAGGTFEQWAQDMTITVYSIYLIRIGKMDLAADKLAAILPRLATNTDIERLRRLEVLALLTLAQRSSGKSEEADENLTKVLKGVEDEFQKTEILLARYLEEANIKSEYVGLNNRTTRFPRLDYFTRIISILVEESIVRGGENTPLPDNTLDRILELDNITHQLARISPPDDPAFFGAQLREYLRLFNGIFWYGDIMINNDGIKRRLLIERAYTRILEWMEFLPVHFWLSLRLSRFLEIFSRAQSWSENIKVDAITEGLLQESSKLHRPSFLYVFAEFNANVGKYDKALDYIKEVLSENYEKDLDDTLRSMAQKLQQSIELESVGILMGITKPNDWMAGILALQLTGEEQIDLIEIDTQSDLMQYGIAIFGDRLVQHGGVIKESIERVGSRLFNDLHWHTSFQEPNMTVDGLRMDIVVISTEVKDVKITLLFEGKKQAHVKLENNTKRLEPSELLLLRGVKHSKELQVNDIIQLLADILTGHSINPFQVYTLKP